MDHVAIMKKNWRLIPKILSGEKTIESRWYMHKVAPWGKINPGDTIYFKNSGEKVSVRVRVRKVLQINNLDSYKVKEILAKYGARDGLDIDDLDRFYELFKDKKYCILIFLEKPVRVKPFEIDKTGFGAMAAWMCVEDINRIKVIS